VKVDLYRATDKEIKRSICVCIEHVYSVSSVPKYGEVFSLRTRIIYRIDICQLFRVKNALCHAVNDALHTRLLTAVQRSVIYDLKLSRRQDSIKSSREISRVRCIKETFRGPSRSLSLGTSREDFI
jgi:hypothetical protein